MSTIFTVEQRIAARAHAIDLAIKHHAAPTADGPSSTFIVNRKSLTDTLEIAGHFETFILRDLIPESA